MVDWVRAITKECKLPGPTSSSRLYTSNTKYRAGRTDSVQLEQSANFKQALRNKFRVWVLAERGSGTRGMKGIAYDLKNAR